MQKNVSNFNKKKLTSLFFFFKKNLFISCVTLSLKYKILENNKLKAYLIREIHKK